MIPSLRVEIAGRPIEQVAADLVAVGCFEDERPLRGAISRVDWRLCGLVSELLEDGHFRARDGEALLLPTFGRLHAGRVLVLGLGPKGDHSAEHVEAATRDAVVRARDLGARRLALSPPGVPQEDFPSHAAALLAGAVAALRGSDRTAELDVMLCVSEAPRTVRAVEEAFARTADPAVRFTGPLVEPATRSDFPQGVSPSA